MERKSKSKRILAPRIAPPECLCCGSENPWINIALKQKTTCRGQAHEVIAEVTQCRHCDAVTTSSQQDASLLEKSKQAHSKWIKTTLETSRGKLKLPQREFAAALGISTATLSRALKADGLIDPSTETLLLIKTRELDEAREIKELLNLKLKKTSVVSGDSSEDWEPYPCAADSNELALAA